MIHPQQIELSGISDFVSRKNTMNHYEKYLIFYLISIFLSIDFYSKDVDIKPASFKHCEAMPLLMKPNAMATVNMLIKIWNQKKQIKTGQLSFDLNEKSCFTD